MSPKPRGMPQQAFSPSYRSPRAGYRQRGSSSLYYTDGSKTGARIDARPQAARMMGGPSEGPLAPRGNQFLPNRPKTRQDNIDAARMDGTFDAKRAAYNAANKGSYMDERGVIGPKAPLSNNNLGNESAAVAPTAPSTAAATTTIGQAQSMREAGAPIPGQDRWGRTAQSPSAKGVPASQFNQANPSSSARGEWQSGGPSRHYGTSSVSFAPKTTTSPSPSGTTAGTDANGKPVSVAPRPSGIGAVDAVNSLPSKQQSGAMFKGDDGKWKTRAEWFGDAAKRQGQGNAYSNEAMAQSKPSAPATPAAKPAPIVAPAGSPVAASSVVATKQPATTSTPAGVPKPTMSDPAAQERYNKAMKVASTPVAPAASPSKAPAAAPAVAAVMPQPQSQPQAAAPPASSMTTAAVRPPPVSQAVKNPQGMSARMGADQPSPMPKILADPIGTVGRGVAAAADAVGSAITSTAEKNPQGLSAKLTRLFSPTKPRQVATR